MKISSLHARFMKIPWPSDEGQFGKYYPPIHVLVGRGLGIGSFLPFPKQDDVGSVVLVDHG